MLLVQPVPAAAVGCPGDKRRRRRVGCGVRRRPVLASGTLVEGCGGLSVSSPRMPSIWGATEVATSGAVALSYPVLPDDSRYLEIGVENADWTCATVPDTGSDNPVAEGVADRQPLLLQAGTDLGDGRPRRSELLRELQRRQEVPVLGRIADRTLLAPRRPTRPDHAGLSVTVSGKDVEVGAGPTRVAPGGTRP